jgi:hypothetical protein
MLIPEPTPEPPDKSNNPPSFDKVAALDETNPKISFIRPGFISAICEKPAVLSQNPHRPNL